MKYYLLALILLSGTVLAANSTVYITGMNYSNSNRIYDFNITIYNSTGTVTSQSVTSTQNSIPSTTANTTTSTTFVPVKYWLLNGSIITSEGVTSNIRCSAGTPFYADFMLNITYSNGTSLYSENETVTCISNRSATFTENISVNVPIERIVMLARVSGGATATACYSNECSMTYYDEGHISVSLPQSQTYNITSNDSRFAATEYSYTVGTDSYYNVTIPLYEQNSVLMTFRDITTLALLGVNVNVTLEGATASYNYSTNNGTILTPPINPDTYYVIIQANGYNNNLGTLTTNGDFSSPTYYMDSNTNLVDFSVTSALGDPVSNATVTFSRTINGSVQSFAQTTTDFSGLFSLYLNPNVIYSVTVTHPSTTYLPFTGSVRASLSTTYNIVIQLASSSGYNSTLTDIYYEPLATYNNVTNFINVTWEVISGLGELDYFSLNTTYNGTSYSQNLSGSPSGGIAFVNISGVNLSVQNSINVSFYIKRNGYDAVVFNYPFTFLGVSEGNNSITGGLFSNNTPSSGWGRAILGMIIVIFCMAGMYRLSSGSTDAMLATAAILIGMLSVPSINMFPWLYGLIAVIVLVIMLLGINIRRGS